MGSLRRRVSQWFDWMLPEAWSVEHNELHHYRLGEEADPDLVQRNLAFVRAMKAPKVGGWVGGWVSGWVRWVRWLVGGLEWWW